MSIQIEVIVNVHGNLQQQYHRLETFKNGVKAIEDFLETHQMQPTSLCPSLGVGWG
jgi:hypothetical protein